VGPDAGRIVTRMARTARPRGRTGPWWSSMAATVRPATTPDPGPATTPDPATARRGRRHPAPRRRHPTIGSWRRRLKSFDTKQLFPSIGYSSVVSLHGAQRAVVSVEHRWGHTRARLGIMRPIGSVLGCRTLVASPASERDAACDPAITTLISQANLASAPAPLLHQTPFPRVR
jgi:hypothetical protein